MSERDAFVAGWKDAFKWLHYDLSDRAYLEGEIRSSGYSDAPPPGDGGLREPGGWTHVSSLLGLAIKRFEDILETANGETRMTKIIIERLKDERAALGEPVQMQGVEITSELDGTHRIDPPAPQKL